MIDTQRIRARQIAVEGNYPVHLRCLSEAEPNHTRFGAYCHGCEKDIPIGEMILPHVDRDLYIEDLGEALRRIDELEEFA